MLRAINRSFKVAATKVNVPATGILARNFSAKLDISVDAEQQYGRRKEELEGPGFNRDPIVPPAEAGTKENPILVPSALHSRVVGFEDPNTHQLVWFNLEGGALHYIPEVNLYFKLDALH